jgi:hypothetical protein
MTDDTDFQRVPTALDEISLKGYQFHKKNASPKNLEISFGRFDMIYFMKSIKIKF